MSDFSAIDSTRAMALEPVAAQGGADVRVERDDRVAGDVFDDAVDGVRAGEKERRDRADVHHSLGDRFGVTSSAQVMSKSYVAAPSSWMVARAVDVRSSVQDRGSTTTPESVRCRSILSPRASRPSAVSSRTGLPSRPSARATLAGDPPTCSSGCPRSRVRDDVDERLTDDQDSVGLGE